MDKPISLSKLFQEKVFRVPDYQRGYAWQNEQRTDFWEDLVNIPDGKKHYTGMVAIQSMQNLTDDGQWMVNELEFNPYYIVDGQQRLTTAIILINEIVQYAKKHNFASIGEKSIRDIIGQYLYKTRINGNVKGHIFGYETTDSNAAFFESGLLGESVWDEKNDTFYIKNLKAASKFFKENIENYCGEDESTQPEKLNDLFKKLVYSMTFNIYEIENQEDVFVIFETMNNRGKRLSNLELLKNRLIYLSTLVNDYDEIARQSLRAKINKSWSEIYKQLGSNPEYSLSDDDFLRDHWIMYFKYSRTKGSIYISDLLDRFSHKKLFNKTAIGQTIEYTYSDSVEVDEECDQTYFAPDAQGAEEGLSAGFIEKYITSLQEFVKFWSATFFPERSNILDNSIKHQISKMNHLGMGYFRPLISSILYRYSKDHENKKMIENTLMAMERFSFIYFCLGHNNASGYSTEFYNMSRYIYYKKDQNDLPFGIENVFERLNAVTKENENYCLESFTNKINKYINDGEGYYKWKGKYYFFYEYESEKRGKNESKIDWDSYYRKLANGDVSIEHILPQTSGSTAKKALEEDIKYWNERFGLFTDKQRETLTGSIGNLLALSKSVNSSLQNHSYAKKRNPQNNERDRGYYNGSYSEIEVAEQYSDWSATAIFERSRNLIDFMRKHWNIDFSEEQQKRLIPLDFING